MRFRYQLITALLVFLVSTAGASDVFSQTLPPTEMPTPSIGPKIQITEQSPAPAGNPVVRPLVDLPRPEGVPPLTFTFPGFNFDDNNTVAGSYYIPPDPHGAAGPFHVVNVGNVMIQWFTNTGVMQNHQSLNNFFSPLGPPLSTNSFDPKVIYDQYDERFVVVSLERLDTGGVEDSYILVAVSTSPDPNSGWFYLAIPSKVNIGGTDTWADYPGIAVDDKAIYITNNMFGFSSTGFGYHGVRLWIIHKNPFYFGGPATWTIHDPYASGGTQATTQPAHMFGPPPASMGTFLCSYSGISDGTNEYVQVVRVLNPTGAVGFSQQFVPVGNIEGPSFPSLPDAPQSGTSNLVEVNDRRALNAVWRNNELWVSTTYMPNSGADVNQTTAHWFKLNAINPASVSLSDQGDVGAEDLGNNTYTFFPSLMLDKCGNMGIGFSASNSQIYPGAYYTGRLTTDPPGTVQPTGALAVGQDWYYRTFGAGRNRWGDYSGIALDPGDEVTLWVFNEYAMLRGTPLGTPPEDGRWSTQWGSFAMGCQPVSVSITAFHARLVEGNAVELTANFASDSQRFRVDVFRVDRDASQPRLYKSLDVLADEPFQFVDRFVEPGKTYHYHLAVEDEDGRFLSPTSKVAIPASKAILYQNVPNPFNPVTAISFNLPTSEHVKLAIYDTNGKLVRVLLDGVRGYGRHEVEWNGTDNLGSRVGSGVYFYRLETGSFRQSMKMLLLK